MSKDHERMSRHPGPGPTSEPVGCVVSLRALVCSAVPAVILVSYALLAKDIEPGLLEFLRAAGGLPAWGVMALGLLLGVELVASIRVALISTMAGLAVGLCAGLLTLWLGGVRGGAVGRGTARLGRPLASRLLEAQGRRQLPCLDLWGRGITVKQGVHVDHWPCRITAAAGVKVGASPTGSTRALDVPLSGGTRAAVGSERQRPSAGRLTAAVEWGGVKLYGHHMQSAAVHCGDLTGEFTALNVEYGDGRRVLWVYLEARRDLQEREAEETASTFVRLLEERSAAFREKRSKILQENGEADFGEQLRIVVLPFGHRAFEPPTGRKQQPYIRPLMQSTELPPATGTGGPLS